MKKRLEKEIKSLPKEFVVLTLLPRNKYEDLNMHMIKLVMNRNKTKGNYITVNKPYRSLIKNMEKNKIQHSDLHFIDCISEKGEKVDNCLFLKSAESLTNIGIALNPYYKNKDFSFIFLDSLDTLSVYHDIKMVLKFARSLINKVRRHEMSGVMIGLHEDTDNHVINELSIICDKMIDLTK